MYKQIKTPLVGEHAFPLTGFVCMAAHVTQVMITYMRAWMSLRFGKI